MVFGLAKPRMPEIRLVGRDVMVRPPSARDEAAWTELRRVSRDFLVPWEPSWPPDATTPAAFQRRVRRFAEEWRQGVTYAFFIFGSADDELLGGITLSNVRRGVAQAGSLGYWIGEPHAHKGYMTEAVQLVLDFAFESLGLHRVEAACLPSNARSQALLHKSGFVKEGLARQYLRINSEWQDHAVFAILRHDPRPGSGHRPLAGLRR